MKYSVGCGGLFRFATGATPGIRLLALAVVGMTAFPAFKSFLPFHVSKVGKTLIFGLKILFEPHRIDLAK